MSPVLTVPEGGVWALGFMSGTSAEGVDAALVRTDGETVFETGPTVFEPLTREERGAIRAAMREALEIGQSYSEMAGTACKSITAAHLRAVSRLPIAPRPAVAGFHGQTLLHRPPPAETPFTWQVGNAQEVADALRVPVVHDLRTQDLEAGGQGAPLVPVYHRALVRSTGLAEPVAVVNIGGVANLTYVDGDTLIAFDVGPGNAPLDEWAERHLGLPFDEDGRHALAGTPDALAVRRFLSDPFFAAPPPKSLDRYSFAPTISGAPNDEAATLAAMTVAGIVAAQDHLPRAPKRWIVAGGGARNPAIMQGVEAALDAPVESAEALGWRGDFLEAEAFAMLAVRHLRGLPVTFPGTTGAPHPMPGGRMAEPR